MGSTRPRKQRKAVHDREEKGGEKRFQSKCHSVRHGEQCGFWRGSMSRLALAQVKMMVWMSGRSPPRGLQLVTPNGVRPGISACTVHDPAAKCNNPS